MKKTILAIFEFCYLQINSCIFGISLLLLIALTAIYYPPNSMVSRMDFLSLSAIVIQLSFILFKIETIRESMMIFIFHFLGMSMEIFKTQMGSWYYSLGGIFYIQEVPLFTGFMYASVGSYILRMQRNFHCNFQGFPRYWQVLLLGVLAYINFLTHHFMIDLRWCIFLLSIIVFRRTFISLRISAIVVTIPYLFLLLSYGGLLWIAENIGSYYTVWKYPHQLNGWDFVSPQKMISWYLLVLTALTIIYLLYPVHNAYFKETRILKRGQISPFLSKK